MFLPVLKLLLTSIDILVLCVVVALLVNHCKSQHDIRSWATAFYLLVLIWLTLRGLFWLMTITSSDYWHSWTFYLLYWLPNPLQFGSFLLLPLFYGQMISSRRAWTKISRVIAPVYITVVLGMVLFMVAWAIMEAFQEQKESQCVSATPRDQLPPTGCYHTEFSSEAFRMLTSLCFFALAIVVVAFGMQVSKLTGAQQRRFLIYHPKALRVLNYTLCTIFLSKGLYQVVWVLKLWYLPDLPLQGEDDIYLLNFLVFVCWDYVPTVLLLLMVVRGPGKAGKLQGNPVATTLVTKVVRPMPRGKVGDPQSLPDYGLFLEIKKHAEAEAAALAQNSPPSEESELSPSPVLVNTWLREDSRSFSYSPSTSYGSYSYTSPRGGVGYGNINTGSHYDHDPDSARDSSYGTGNMYGFITLSPGSSRLAGEMYVSSAPSSSSGGPKGTSGLFEGGFWGGRRGRSNSGNANVGGTADHGWGPSGRSITGGDLKSGPGRIGSGGGRWIGRSKSDVGSRDKGSGGSSGGVGGGGGGFGFFSKNYFSGLSGHSTRSTCKSDPGIIPAPEGERDGDSEDDQEDKQHHGNKNRKKGKSRQISAERTLGLNLWNWWLKTTGGGGGGGSIARGEGGGAPTVTPTVNIGSVTTAASPTEYSSLLHQQRGQDEVASRGSEVRETESCVTSAYGGREQFPLRQPDFRSFSRVDDRAVEGGDAGVVHRDMNWSGYHHQQQQQQHRMPDCHREGDLEGGARRGQGGDAENPMGWRKKPAHANPCSAVAEAAGAVGAAGAEEHKPDTWTTRERRELTTQGRREHRTRERNETTGELEHD